MWIEATFKLDCIRLSQKEGDRIGLEFQRCMMRDASAEHESEPLSWNDETGNGSWSKSIGIRNNRAYS